MNKVAASVYARGFDAKPITDEEARDLLGRAIAEINRQHELLGNPIVRGCIEHFGLSRGVKHG